MTTSTQTHTPIPSHPLEVCFLQGRPHTPGEHIAELERTNTALLDALKAFIDGFAGGLHYGFENEIEQATAAIAAAESR